MSKFVKILIVVLVVLFIIGAVTGNSHVANSFCNLVESLCSLVSGIFMNIAHGLSWIVKTISNIFG